MPILVVAALAVFTPWQSSFPTGNVTFTTRAARAAVAVPALGKAAGQELLVSPIMADEVILVSVANRPLGEVMERIATVTSGTWKPAGNGFRLVPDPIKRKAEEAARLAARVNSLTQGLKFFAKKIDKQATRVDEALKAQKPGSPLSPEQIKILKTRNDLMLNTMRTEMAIVQQLGISNLARIGGDERVVWSNHPTAMQLPMDSTIADLIGNFVQVRNGQLSNLPPPKDIDVSDLTSHEIEVIRIMRRQRTAKIESVAKINLMAKVNGNDGDETDIRYQLRLYDASGTVLLNTEFNLGRGGPYDDKDDSGEPSIVGESGKDRNTGTPIQWSGDSRAILDAHKLGNLDDGILHINADLQRKLYHPEKFEPLSFVQTDELLSYAKLKGKPIVADLPDYWNLESNLLGGEEADSVEEVAKDIESKQTLTDIEDPRYTLIQPTSPPKSRKFRTDRFALSNLLHAVEVKVIPSLDDFAVFALQSNERASNGIALGYMMNLIPSDSGFDLGTWETLRIYGLMNPDSKAKLLAGDRIPLRSLSNDQKVALSRLVYGPDQALEKVRDAKSAGNSDLTENLDMFSGISYLDEPTEVAPNGIPADGYLELGIKHEPFATPATNAALTYEARLATLTVDQFAQMRLAHTTGEPDESGNIPPQISRFRVGELDQLDFHFHLSPQIMASETATNYRLSDHAEVVTMDTLPETMKAQISKRFEILLNASGDTTGRTKTIHP